MSFRETLDHPSSPFVRAIVFFRHLVFFLMFFIPISVMAAKITINPTIEIKGEYNDNILFTRTNQIDDYIATISPAVTFNYQTELLNLKANIAMDILRYADQDNLNTENPRFDLNGGYQLQERTKVSGRLSFIKDTTLQSELEETGLVTVLADRKRYNAGGGLSYELSEKSNVDLNYTHSKTDYDWPGSIDSDENRVVMSYNRQLTDQRDVFTVQPYYSHTASEASIVDNYGLSLGLFHMFSETLTLTAFLGARYSDIAYTLVQPQVISDPTLFPPYRVIYTRVRETEKTWGGVADISLKSIGELGSTTIGYNRDISFSSFGEPIERDRIGINTDRMLTKRFGVGFSGDLYFTKSEGKFQDRDSRYFELRPSLNYRFAENYWLRAYYTYSQDFNKILTSNQEADRNRIWITLYSEFPKEW